MNSGVTTPFDTLIRREFARALAFEKKNALGESIVVVMATDGWAEREEEEDNEYEQ